MKIANIVHEKELVNHTKVEYVNYFNQPIEYDKLDKTLPTLYVGWSFMKACNPNNPIIQNAEILRKKIITNELYWECSFEESKASHVKGVDNFVNIAPQFYFTPKFKFTNLDPVFFQLNDIEDLMDVVPKELDALYNFKGEMLYIRREDKIWAINLLMYSYFKFDVNEIICKIGARSLKQTTDSEGNVYVGFYKIFSNFNQLKRYVVTMI